MKNDHAAQVENLNSAAERKLDLMKQDMTMEKKKAIEELSVNHTTEVKTIKGEQETLITRLNNQFD